MNPIPQPVEMDEIEPPRVHAQPIVRAVVENRKNRWVFPVVAGTPQAVVLKELNDRFALAGGREGTVMASDATRVAYPDGPYPNDMLNVTPPLGWNDELYGPYDRAAWVEQPPPEPARPAPRPVNNAPPSAGPPTNPLPPGPYGQPSGEQGAMSDLDMLLAGWRQRHQLTSAEYYLYVTRMLAYHASSLVARERQPRGAPRGPDYGPTQPATCRVPSPRAGGGGGNPDADAPPG